MSQAGVLTVKTGGGSLAETLTGNSGGAVGPDGAFNINVLGTNSSGINIVGSPGTNTLMVIGITATTAQQGTVTLATNAQAIAGVDASNAVTSAALGAKLGTQTTHSLAVFEGSSSALTALGAATNGQLPIGSTGADPVLATLTSTGGTITITNGAGSINLDLAGGATAIEKIAVDANTAPGTNPVVPTGGQITMTGAQVATGTIGANVIRTDSLAANSLTIQIQRSTAVAATDSTKNGVSHFDSASFAVDASGFVTASGTGILKTLTGNSGGAISPTAGNINTLGTGSITIAGSGSTLTTQLTGLTNHNVLIGAGTATITNVAPSATSGVPLISQGAAADPAFGTAVVAGGGTGATSFTAYAPICGGTTTTGILQSAATGIGTSGFVLTSTGAASLPTWQAVSAAGAVETINGDTGSITPTAGTVTIKAGSATSNSGSSVTFTNSGSTSTLNVTDANFSTFIGHGAGSATAFQTNTGVGASVLPALNGSGAQASDNTCVGYGSGNKITTGSSNTAIGSQALNGPTTGVGNIAIGPSSGNNYTSSESNNIVISNGGVLAESNVIRIGTQGSGSRQQNQCFIAGIAGVTSVSSAVVAGLATGTGQLVQTTITAGTGISVTPAAGTITIAVSGSAVLQTLTGNSGGGDFSNSRQHQHTGNW